MSNHDQVLAALAWEQFANNLEEWLDDGHPAPLPPLLEARPAGAPPAHLADRLPALAHRLTVAQARMRIERDGLDTARRAARQAATAAGTLSRNTPAYLDTDA